MATAPAPSRGEIWLVDFDPAVGAETRKLRPALIMSVNTIGRLPLRMVVPIMPARRRGQVLNRAWHLMA